MYLLVQQFREWTKDELLLRLNAMAILLLPIFPNTKKQSMDSRQTSLLKRILLGITANPTKVSYLAALRPRQWMKNLAIALPLFAFSINLHSALGSLLPFVLFFGLLTQVLRK